MEKQLSIVLPVYNEAENILQTLSEIHQHIFIPHEILIIYDFDEDNTLSVLTPSIISQHSIKLIKNIYGRGVLNAIKTGFQFAQCEAVLVMMADLSDDLSTVHLMYQKLISGCHVVCGSRYMPGGRQIGGPFLKRNLSRFAGLILHHFFGFPVHDLTNSFKMYSKKLLNHISIQSTGGFELGMEILIKAYILGYRITEVPTVWRDREKGKSKFKLMKWIPKYGYWYIYAIYHLLKKKTHQ